MTSHSLIMILTDHTTYYVFKRKFAKIANFLNIFIWFAVESEIEESFWCKIYFTFVRLWSPLYYFIDILNCLTCYQNDILGCYKLVSGISYSDNTQINADFVLSLIFYRIFMLFFLWVDANLECLNTTYGITRFMC